MHGSLASFYLHFAELLQSFCWLACLPGGAASFPEAVAPREPGGLTKGQACAMDLARVQACQLHLMQKWTGALEYLHALNAGQDPDLLSSS